MPCTHASAVLKEKNLNPYEYCSKLCMKETMLASYGGAIYPIGSKDECKIPTEISEQIVLPPRGEQKKTKPTKPIETEPNRTDFSGLATKVVWWWFENFSTRQMVVGWRFECFKNRTRPTRPLIYYISLYNLTKPNLNLTMNH